MKNKILNPAVRIMRYRNIMQQAELPIRYEHALLDIYHGDVERRMTSKHPALASYVLYHQIIATDPDTYTWLLRQGYADEGPRTRRGHILTLTAKGHTFVDTYWGGPQ